MRKKMKQFLRKSLCGVLCTAMLFAGVSIPELSMKAAEVDISRDTDVSTETELTGTEATEEESNNDESTLVQERTSVERTEETTEESHVEETETTISSENDAEYIDNSVDVMPVSGNEITLSYYVGDTDEEVGLYYWGSVTPGSSVSSADWKITNWKDILYLMKAESAYPGWYSINITVNDADGSSAGLRIYKKSDAVSDADGYLLKCDGWDNKDIYAEILALESGSICIKDGKTYSSIAEAEGNEELEETTKDYNTTVSLNFYYGDLDANAAEGLGFYIWGDGITTKNDVIESWSAWGDSTVYAMTKVDGYSGWFNIEYAANETITFKGVNPTKSKSSFSIFTSKDVQNPVVNDCSGFGGEENYSDIYLGLLEGTITAIMYDKAGTLHGYATIEEAEENREPEESTEPTEGKKWTFDELTTLINEAEKYNGDDYTVASWKVFASALDEAKKITDESGEANIIAAYEKLGIAKNTLVEGTVSVAKLVLADDFITGADISSYYSLRQSGVVFKDEEGNKLDDAAFFKYLKDGGTNWVRIRVWNNPFDSNGNGYGGGNNDINAAKEIGKWATDAGIRVLIDFHYSDFWADPSKQKEPKAWTGYTLAQKVEAIETYTKESLQTLKNAGVDVGMVQVGNETTNEICGVKLTNWSESSQIFNAGSKGVKAIYPNALVAIHFTNPDRNLYGGFAKNLNAYNVNYDVFASSYYPFWHGTLENLTTQLANIAKTYDKKVMVAETSWAYTLSDQDGHANTVRKGQNDKGQSYDFSVQGQADELRAVIKAVNAVNETAPGKGIGVFYWESAWNSKNYVYRADGSVNKDLLDENKSLWEEHGSGWAASYASEYDAEDAGKWFGGSAVDNQSWFDAFCNALPTAKVYSYIRSGETAAERAVKNVKNPSINMAPGDQLAYPEKVTVEFNDDTKVDYAVNWNAEDQAIVDTSKSGTYEVKGTVSCEYTLNDGSTTKTEELEVLLTITIEKLQGTNILTNPGFEDGKSDPWVVMRKDNFGADAKVSSTSSSNFHSGKWSLHFYNGSTNIGFTAEQEVKSLKAGEYTFGGYLCGTDNNGNSEVQLVYVKIYGSDGQLKDTVEEKFALSGNNDWSNPEVTGIQVSEGDYLVVGISIEAEKGAWGDVDDLYLYADSTVETPSDETKEYKDVTVNLNYYIGDIESDEEIGFYCWDDDEAKDVIKPDVTKNPQLDWYGWNNSINTLYKMNPVEGYSGWYNISFTVNETIVINSSDSSKNSSIGGFTIFRSTQKDTPLFADCSGYDGKNPEVYRGLLEGEITAVLLEGSGLDGYATIKDAEAARAITLEQLQTLVSKAKSYKAEDYKEAGWQKFQDAISAAETVIAKEDRTSAEIKEAYNNLKEAMQELKPASIVEAEINVEQVALADDFILGADISSYYTLKESGTKFYDDEGKELDDQGFFDYLAAGGTNWVRIRVWNDPYLSTDSTKGYGGGNNDLDKAITMGQWATKAGMKVLIDFHYSDFWADPGKQQAPKAWEDMTLAEKEEAVKEFTKDCLTKLINAGVDVGMVQVGNETNNGIAGETGAANMAKIFNAGSEAVKEVDSNILVALHFTNPENGVPTSMSNTLNANNVNYDVFATSYYPYWHGTLDNLTKELAYVAKTYNKKVMVAETSWATTLEDGDGWGNTVAEGSNDGSDGTDIGGYSFSVQGQADEIRAVVNATNNVNNQDGVAANSAIGVFYWESAWISAKYAYDEDGKRDEEIYKENQNLWETHGSGWASSYATEYDPEDAGKWYGGSAVDNQAWFDFYGKAFPTAKVYSYIRTGAEADLAVASVDKPSVTIEEDRTIEYPKTVAITFNDGTVKEYDVIWNATDIGKVDVSKAGTYTVSGTITIIYTNNSGEQKDIRTTTLTVTVKHPVGTNLLINPGFEDDGTAHSGWIAEGTGFTDEETGWKENPYSGTYAMHFYSGSSYAFTVKQKVENLDAGIYTFGCYIQGGGTTADDLQYVIATVYDNDGNKVRDYKSEACTLDGWHVWKNPEITNIDVPEGGAVEVGMQVQSTKGGMWGTFDDLYLFGTYDITVDDSIEDGIGTLTANKEKAVSGQTIVVKAKPDTGYYLTTLTITGKSVNDKILTSENGTVSYDSSKNTITITYPAKSTGEMVESFTMPSGNVAISATFEATGESVDKTLLESLIKAYEGTEKDKYTDTSWKIFADALAEAKAVAENANVTQMDVNKVKAALEAAYAGLEERIPEVIPVDKTELNDLIAGYEDVEQGDYTNESWKVFTNALEAAKEVAGKEDATQEEVDEAKAVLQAAYRELKSPTGKPIDKVALNALIKRYGGTEQGNYTNESWKAFTDALETAKEVAGKEDATQEEVDAAKTALETAYQDLKESEEKPVDKTELNELISGYEETKQGDYTDKSWETFTNALEAAKEIAAKEDATQEEVDAAKKTLETAFRGLVSSTGKPVVDKVALNALITRYADIEQGDYTDESWKVFTDALEVAKEVAAKEDATQEEVDEAKVTLEAAHEGLKKPSVEPADKRVLNNLIETLGRIEKENYSDVSWKNFTDALAVAKTVATKTDATQEEVDAAKTALEAAYNGLIREGLWAEWTEDWKEIFGTDKTVSYTGGAIKPTVNVYDGEKELVLKKDYTISYKNNKNLGEASVIIKGKGNYTSSDTLNFKIEAKSLDEEDVAIPNLYAMKPTNGKPVTLKPVVTIGKTKLKIGRDYIAEYVLETAGIEKGTYDVKVSGKGNYTGSRIIKISLADKANGDVLMSSVSISKISDQSYTGLELFPEVTVKYKGKIVDKADYHVTYQNNTEVGVATVIVEGTENGKFIGQKTATFKIAGITLAAKKVTLVDVPNSGRIYTGKPIEPDVEVKAVEDGKEIILTRDTHYSVEYSNNEKVGKATATVKGIGAYSGTITKTFKITAYDINKDENQLFKYEENFNAPYAKGGSKPDGKMINATFNNNSLVQGRDFTLSYSNNKKLTENKPAVVKIKGKGNYKGTVSVNFMVVRQQIGSNGLTITAEDILLKDSAKKYNKVVPVITDVDGKKLKKGTDFIIKGYSKGGDPTTLAEKDLITIEVEGVNNYEGTTTVNFRIIGNNNSLSKATIIVTPQTYTGQELKPKGSDVVVKMKVKEGNTTVTKELVEGTDYMIIDYANNVNKGTKAKLTIKGIGEYGGTKTKTFKINTKGMKWSEVVEQTALWLKEALN